MGDLRSRWGSVPSCSTSARTCRSRVKRQSARRQGPEALWTSMGLLWNDDSAVSGFGPKRVERLINSSTTCLSRRAPSQKKSPPRPPASTQTHPKLQPATGRPPPLSADFDLDHPFALAAAYAESCSIDRAPPLDSGAAHDSGGSECLSAGS